MPVKFKPSDLREILPPTQYRSRMIREYPEKRKSRHLHSNLLHGLTWLVQARSHGIKADAVMKDLLEYRLRGEKLQQKLAENAQITARKCLQYSVPDIEEVERAWPLKAFSKRQYGSNPLPRLIFDITRDPTEPTQDGLYLFDDESQSRLSQDILDE
ncbi:hypothetical protein H0H87_001030, partial [Tephrocybe sp. NHM501043]